METSDDPIFTPAVMMGAMGVGTGVSVLGHIQEGKRAEDIGEARAAIDIRNAEAATRRSAEEAKILQERGRRLLATQKAAAAAGNIRTNVGAPLVIAAETRADIAKDIGFTLEGGREKSSYYRSRAEIERATGKHRRRQSIWDAISAGTGGFATMGLRGSDAGWW
jgi:hypothetical protein